MELCAAKQRPSSKSRTHNNNNNDNVQKGEKMYHNGTGWQVGGVQYGSTSPASNVALNNGLHV